MAVKKSNDISSLADFDLEYASGRSWIIGVDEAGRGCLAGSVYAGAVAVRVSSYANKDFLEMLKMLNDSKKLTHKQRECLYDTLVQLKSAGQIDFQSGFADVDEIEEHNILGATQIAMSRAIKNLDERLNLGLKKVGSVATLFGESSLDTSIGYILVDGRPMKKLEFAHTAVVKGDGQSLSIAAASIIAKVTRDNYMKDLALKYPRYNFEIHKGYGTASHLQSLLIFGASDIHRPSFLKKLRAEDSKPKPQDELNLSL